VLKGIISRVKTVLGVHKSPGSVIETPKTVDKNPESVPKRGQSTLWYNSDEEAAPIIPRHVRRVTFYDRQGPPRMHLNKQCLEDLTDIERSRETIRIAIGIQRRDGTIILKPAISGYQGSITSQMITINAAAFADRLQEDGFLANKAIPLTWDNDRREWRGKLKDAATIKTITRRKPASN